MVDLVARAENDGVLALDIIERLFFGYRDFVGIADEHLASRGYGRAHHRVLHFVDRHPGLTVGELLAILKVTKQGLGRTLRTLVEDGLVTVRPGERDRREKRLATTPEGHALARELMSLQTARVEAALAAGGPGARETVATVLAHLVDAHERDEVVAMIRGGR